MISREQAAKIASIEAIQRALGTGVSDVLSVSELTGRPPVLYGVELDGCWIAYITSNRPPGLYGSTIVVISQVSGETLYAGSANDEG